MPVLIDAQSLKTVLARQIVAVNERNIKRRAEDGGHSNWSYTIRDAAVSETLMTIINALDELIAEAGDQ